MRARTATELAAKWRAEAARLAAAADILDPPRKRKRHRRRRKTAPPVPGFAPRVKAVGEGARRAGVTLELGTRGRTSHPSDPDAEALGEALVHTTGEP